MVITVLTYDTAVCASPNGLSSSPYAPNASTVTVRPFLEIGRAHV